MTVTATNQAQAEAYTAVQAKPFTRVLGHNTIKDMNLMYEEVCNLATAVNTGV